MEIEQRRLPRLDVLTLTGRIDAVDSPKLQQAIEQLFDQGRFNILLDFSGVTYINSAALRVLVGARKRAHEQKRGDVRIVHLPERVRRVFDLVGFAGLFEIYDDMVEAVASF